jgi:hypothetical protein
MLSSLLFAALLSCAAAHICILSPLQRSPTGIPNAGANNCYRRAPECGGTTPGPVTATYIAGSAGDVVLQQNFNHWFGQAQGFIDVAISTKNVVNPSDSDFRVLYSTADYPAHEQVTQTNFSLPVTWPNVAVSRAVLRVRYVSNNPGEAVPNNTRSTFYNCADIALSATGGVKPAVPARARAEAMTIDAFAELAHRVHADLVEQRAIVRPAAGASALKGCCMAPQFTLDLFTKQATGADVLSLSRRFEVDQTSQLQRFTQKLISGGGPEFSFAAISDYNKGVEYFLNATSGACALYGPDQWYPFCFGDQTDNGTTQHFVTESNKLSIFANGDNSWFWAVANQPSSAPSFCAPVLQYFQSPTTSYLSTLVSATNTVNQQQLTKPSNCK